MGAWSRGYNTSFVLNSVEHELCPVNESQMTNIMIDSFLLNIAEQENVSINKYENVSYCWLLLEFHVQLSRTRKKSYNFGACSEHIDFLFASTPLQKGAERILTGLFVF